MLIPMLRRLAPLLLVAGTAGALLAALAGALPAGAGERDSSRRERAFGEPPVFRDANGGAFRPRSLIVTGPGGALEAPIPQNPRAARSENRVDLSGAPLVGGLFRSTLDVDSVRRGPLVGQVFRAGDALVVETADRPSDLTRRRVALATNVPRQGAVSFQLGRLDWRAAGRPSPERTPLGTAHIVNGDLVLASQGGEPAWPSLESLFRDLF
jgi:hypothetical protein